VKTHNQKKKTSYEKGRGLLRSSIENILFVIRLDTKPRIILIRIGKEILRRGSLKPMLPRLIRFFIIVFKVNLINNPEQWWVYTSIIIYVCTKKRIFFTYK
jgi:hypothetical protein